RSGANIETDGPDVAFSRVAQAAKPLITGALDAAFVSGHYPVESVRVTLEQGGKLVPLTGAIVNGIRERYPFVRSITIPAGIYPGQTESVETIGIDVVVVARSDLPDSIAYELTRQFFLALPALRPVQPSLRLLDVDDTPATPFPLHEGAIRYYRQWE